MRVLAPMTLIAVLSPATQADFDGILAWLTDGEIYLGSHGVDSWSSDAVSMSVTLHLSTVPTDIDTNKPILLVTEAG